MVSRPTFDALRRAGLTPVHGPLASRPRFFTACLALLLMATMFCAGGCAGPAISERARAPFLDSKDLINMTDKMAAKIAADPVIAAITARGPMVIVLDNLKNETNQIITRGQGDAFLHRVRVLLASHQSLKGRFVFVVNPAALRRLQNRLGLSAASDSPPPGIIPAYALQATFYADTKVSQAFRSDYYLCTFFLTNISTGRIVWEGSYETKKAVHNGFLY